jgi:hypothetical protein
MKNGPKLDENHPKLCPNKEKMTLTESFFKWLKIRQKGVKIYSVFVHRRNVFPKRWNFGQSGNIENKWDAKKPAAFSDPDPSPIFFSQTLNLMAPLRDQAWSAARTNLRKLGKQNQRKKSIVQKNKLFKFELEEVASKRWSSHADIL